MVFTVLPVALFAAPAGGALVLPTVTPGTLSELVAPLSVEDGVHTGVLTPPAAAPSPWIAQAGPADEDSGPASAQTYVGPEELIRSHLLGVADDPKDLDMPVLEFLQKYPALKPEFSRMTRLPALMADHYDFTPQEKALLYGTMRANAFHTRTPGVLIPHYQLAAAGVPVLMATASTLLVDDDCSENNGGPGSDLNQVQFAWLNQTAEVAAALDNNSIAYDLFVSPYGGSIADFMTLTSYDRVIYVSGECFSGIPLTTRNRLTGFVEAEGDMWFIGQLTPYRFFGTLGVNNATTTDPRFNYPDFLLNYMGIASFVAYGTANMMSGVATAFLANQTYNMTRYMPDPGNFGLPVDYANHLNYTATAQALTIGPSVDFNQVNHNNVVNNIRNSPVGKGVVITSAFEYSYINVPSDRDNLTAMAYANLSDRPGLNYDANTDVAPVDIYFTQQIDDWANESWAFVDGAGALLQYYLIFGGFVEVGQQATVQAEVENYRNAAFTTDVKIQLEGDQLYNPASRIENSTRIAALLIPARGIATTTLTFTPHRVWIQDVHVLVAQTTPDSYTKYNELYFPYGYVGVAGYFDGAETLRAGTVADGFAQVYDPGVAPEGNSYWFTGTGANLNNTLTFPWIDTRYFNGSGPGRRSNFFINDFLFFFFRYRGDVTAPDVMEVEFRNESAMTWTSMATVNGPTGSPLGWYNFSASWQVQNNPPVFLVTFGVPVSEFDGDQFVQVRLRYVTQGNPTLSIGYQIDSIGWTTWQEKNAPVDFFPLFINSIPAPPTYTVWQGATPIASGPVNGSIIDINETENVTFDAYMEDPHGDSFTWAWSQSINGAATLPSPGNQPTGFAHSTWTFQSDMDTYERFKRAANTNLVTFILTATDELVFGNTSVWTLRVRDAPPVWSPSAPTNFVVDEDSTVYFPATGLNAWFTDPQGDPITLSSTSPIVNGTPTVTVSDKRAIDGTIGIRASSPDWCGLTNMTITATDNKTSSVQQMVDVTINCINDAPRLRPGEADKINLTTGEQRRFIRFNVTLFDVDDPQSSLTVVVVSNPADKWEEGRNATGNLQLTAQLPDNGMVGYNWFNVTICDPQNACAVIAFHVFITNVNDPPSFVSTGDTRHAQQGLEYREQLQVSDPDDQVPGASRTVFTWTDDTNLFEINTTGWIIFTPTNDQVGSWAITVRVSDGTATAPLAFTLIVDNTNDAPVLPPYADINVSQDVDFTAPLIKAQDPDLALWNKGVTESLIYTDDCALFNIELVQQPSPTPGAPPDPVGRIRIHATNEQVGDWVCTVTVTDAGGLSDALEIHVVVNNVNDAPTGVRINITDDSGDVREVTVSDTKVVYKQDEHLMMNVYASDPDMALRQNDPSKRVNPNEALTCSVFSQFTGSLDVPQTNPEKPTITSAYDPVDGCMIDFTPTNTEVGTFTITVTVRDAAQTSINFKLKLQVDNVNDAPTNVRIVAPTASFMVDATGTLTVSGSAADVDTAESGLTYSWVVEIVGGGRYTSSAKNAQIPMSNTDSGDKVVKVTFKVTDNLDATNPIEVTAQVNGTIKGKPSTPGFELPAVVMGLALVAAVMVVAQRRRRDE
jgi:hypothetical protein